MGSQAVETPGVASSQLLRLEDYAEQARARMEPAACDYLQGGSDDEVTLRANREAFARLHLRPRVLVDVSRCALSTQVLGTAMDMPVAAASQGPLWLQVYCFRRREATASLIRRAEAAGYRALVLIMDAPRLGRREWGSRACTTCSRYCTRSWRWPWLSLDVPPWRTSIRRSSTAPALEFPRGHREESRT